MTAGTLLALLLAAAAAAFVLAPLFRKSAAVEERRALALSEEEELISQREMAMAALKDLEDDRATGKIGDQDYEDFKARLTARAVLILKRQDEVAARKGSGCGGPVSSPSSRPGTR